MGEAALLGPHPEAHELLQRSTLQVLLAVPKQRGCSLVASIPSRIRGSLPSSGHKHLQLPVPAQHLDTQIWDPSRA